MWCVRLLFPQSSHRDRQREVLSHCQMLSGNLRTCTPHTPPGSCNLNTERVLRSVFGDDQGRCTYWIARMSLAHEKQSEQSKKKLSTKKSRGTQNSALTVLVRLFDSFTASFERCKKRILASSTRLQNASNQTHKSQRERTNHMRDIISLRHFCACACLLSRRKAARRGSMS